jgi:hypothetical protein
LKKASKATLVLILLIATILLQNPLHAKGESNEIGFSITTTVTYSNKGTNVWNLNGEDYAISLFMNSSWQSVSLVEHSLPLNSVGIDEDGNLLGFLNLTKLNPWQNASYTLKYNIASKPRLLPNITEEQSQTLANINSSLKNEYCKKEGPWLIDDPYLKGNATILAGNETRILSIVKKFVAFIAHNVTYNSAEVPRYPNETLSGHKGDCDDQAILLITLCRIVGIPAYLQVGAMYDFFGGYSKDTYWQGHVTSVLKQIGWHAWAMVYIPPWGWLPVDLTYVLIDPNLNNPLNAIKGAAVTMQNVVQYMNFTHSDYVGASRHLRDLIQGNPFYIYETDEMKINIDFGSIWEVMNLTFEGILIASTVIAVLSTAIFVFRWKKKRKA